MKVVVRASEAGWEGHGRAWYVANQSCPSYMQVSAWSRPSRLCGPGGSAVLVTARERKKTLVCSKTIKRCWGEATGWWKSWRKAVDRWDEGDSFDGCVELQYGCLSGGSEPTVRPRTGDGGAGIHCFPSTSREMQQGYQVGKRLEVDDDDADADANADVDRGGWGVCEQCLMGQN